MPSLLREVLGDVLRRARTNQGRTLRQVSDAARVSLGYLSEVERGRDAAAPSISNGRSACRIISAARSSAPAFAKGSSTGCSGTIGTGSHVS